MPSLKRGLSLPSLKRAKRRPAIKRDPSLTPGPALAWTMAGPLDSRVGAGVLVVVVVGDDGLAIGFVGSVESVGSDCPAVVGSWDRMGSAPMVGKYSLSVRN